MLRRASGWHFSISVAGADAQKARPDRLDDGGRDKSRRSAKPAARAASLANEDADPYDDVNDWDEYDDEIASAAAFAAWQEAADCGWDGSENEADLEIESIDASGSQELWQSCGDWHSEDD